MKARWERPEFAMLQALVFRKLETMEGVVKHRQSVIDEAKEIYDALPFLKRLFTTNPVSDSWLYASEDEWMLRSAKNSLRDLKRLKNRIETVWLNGAALIVLEQDEIEQLDD